jgi:hypothetical protein
MQGFCGFSTGWRFSNTLFISGTQVAPFTANRINEPEAR